MWRVVACVDPVLCGLGMSTNVQGPRVKRVVTSTNLRRKIPLGAEKYLDGLKVKHRRITEIRFSIRGVTEPLILDMT